MFENPLKPKVKGKKIKSPWDFSAPNYDQRSGPSVAAGDYYGVGHKNPMGKIRGNDYHPEVDTYPKKNRKTVINSVV